jgi:hypothetical protein
MKKILSEEHKRNISKANKNKVRSFESRKNVSIGMKGKHNSPSTQFKIGHISLNHAKHPKTEELKTLFSLSKVNRTTNNRVPWNKGKTGVYSEEMRKRMSDAKIGQHYAQLGGHRNLGKIRSEETKRKISLSLKGRHISSATEFKKGRIVSVDTLKNMKIAQNKYIHNGMTGKKQSEETKLKMRGGIGQKGNHFWRKRRSYIGDKNPNWQGGKSFEPYNIDWTETLKRSIRERDHYTCQLNGEIQGDICFAVHHIDYNKKNCDPNNLITLCNRCHIKTNFNRAYWTVYFTKYRNCKEEK